jgi:hypothetical protein
MGGSWTMWVALAAMALLAGGCARKDRVAPCAPGEGLVSSYAAPTPVAPMSLPFGSAVASTEPCGPLRPLNAALHSAPAQE